MLKNFAVTVNGENITIAVDEDWLQSVRINAVDDINSQIYMAAMSDPKRSGIQTNDDAINASIEEVKELIEKAKEVNREKNGNIRILMKTPGTYTVRFADQVYADDLTLREAERAVEKISAYLDHNNMIRVRIIEAKGASALRRAMDLEAFINSRAKLLLAVSDDGDKYTVVYIPKGYKKLIEAEASAYDEDTDR